MVTWHLDRLFRSATACLAVAVALTGAIGFLIDNRSDVENVLGGLLVGALIVGVGGAVGSTVTSAAGVVLFGAVAALAQPGAPMLMLAGATVATAMLLVDLSITTRRAPVVDNMIWRDTAVTIAIVLALAVAMFTIAWFVATRAVWQAVVLPFGVLSLGYAMRFAADVHRRRAGP